MARSDRVDKVIELHGPGLSLDDVVAVARDGAAAVLADDARAAMEASAALIDRVVAGDEPVYGVTTGFGSLATTVIPADRTAACGLMPSTALTIGTETPCEPVGLGRSSMPLGSPVNSGVTQSSSDPDLHHARAPRRSVRSGARILMFPR